MIKIQRIYSGNREPGYCVLVDKIWPRGIKKNETVLDIWLKEIAPGDSLRKWFGHDPEKFSEFKKRYRSELQNNEGIHRLIRLESEHGTLILLFGAKDEVHNQAAVLKEFIEEMKAKLHKIPGP